MSQLHITPRKPTDRGGYLMMPLIKNIPVPKNPAWKRMTCPANVKMRYELPDGIWTKDYLWREILFKGKRLDNGEWIEGCLLIDYITGQCFIHAVGNSVNESNKVGKEGCLKFFAFEIDPSTICRCTGSTDKNGRKIFEGDIIKRTDLHIAKEPSIGFIEYDTDNTSFLIHWTDIANYSPTFPWEDRIEIVGNVFDNPEFLKEMK